MFKQKMENLRTQFSRRGAGHNWQEAIRIGESIMIDFPNTQMAKEVREKMDALRQPPREPNSTKASEMAQGVRSAFLSF